MAFLCGRGKRGGPVIAVAAEGADDLFFGNDLEDGLEVVDEPVLRGDGAGIGVGLVLVVVHQQEAVGVVGVGLQVPFAVAYGDVDVEAQAAGVEVVVDGRDERLVAGLGVGRDGFDVERETAIAGVGGEEAVGLLEEVGARGVAEQEVADLGQEEAFDGIVVVDQGEDVEVDVIGGDGGGDLAVAVDGWAPALHRRRGRGGCRWSRR